MNENNQANAHLTAAYHQAATHYNHRSCLHAATATNSRVNRHRNHEFQTVGHERRGRSETERIHGEIETTVLRQEYYTRLLRVNKSIMPMPVPEKKFPLPPRLPPRQESLLDTIVKHEFDMAFVRSIEYNRGCHLPWSRVSDSYTITASENP